MHRFLFCCAAAIIVSSPLTANGLAYPESETVDVWGEYHGVRVPDPYRWLEGDVRESSEVADWVERQNEVTFGYLDTLPQREQIRQRLTELWDYEKFTAPHKRGGRYYFSKNDGLQNQFVLYVMDTLDSEPRVLLDPNEWSPDGTVALSGQRFSQDGRYMAYGVQDAGSDWRTWRILELDSGRVLEDKLEWIKWSSLSFTKDGNALYYARYEAPTGDEKHLGQNKNQRVYRHVVGTPQSEDILVYERPDEPDWGFSAQVTEDGLYLVLTTWKGTLPRYRVSYIDLTVPDGEVVHLIDDFDHEYSFIANDGPKFFFRTERDAPLRRLIAIDVTNPRPASWREVIPETEDALGSVSLVGDTFFASYLQDAKTRILRYALDGSPLGEVELPGLGTARGFGGLRQDDETFYLFSSYTHPPSIYRYDLATESSSLLRQSEVDFDPADYVTKQVFCESKDGTQFPMFLVHRKDIQPDGERSVLLYGYGGFKISLKPSFSVSRLAWMEMGGVLAVANTRGGGEYGEAWHAAGTKLQKQNVFDDFIAAAEWLIDSGYTTPNRLAIQGGSNGGLLVAACMVQRPELFSAVLPAVGVLDMIRYPEFTAGRFWVDDYGSPDDPDEFRALLAYSPYHNLEDGTEYPATLITTADTDDRVVPGHSFKFAAALQAAQAGPAPTLIRIETRAGHGSGKPTDKIIDEVADTWAFVAEHTGLEWIPRLERVMEAKR